MDFGTAVKTGFRRYLDFEGRSIRSEYWWWMLFVFLVNIALNIFNGSIGGTLLSSLFSLIVLIPDISVSVRRLHDIGKSGWWILLWLVPLIGWVVIVYWAVQEGDVGDNEYGPDPLVAH
ncbi:DUF805 domain-containing protein [Kordiimonas aquimaris]|uniref:DUF805 domain-containing protein n=1 Tax=Kordiimonas aquimaris TaxID=707591 RepID=UPI0021CEFFCA|nr:DUF805 domain-containing protein [Kordiimonas aquimaris]